MHLSLIEELVKIMRLECGILSNLSWEGPVEHMAMESVQFSTVAQFTCQLCAQNLIAVEDGSTCTYQFESMEELFRHYQAVHINLLRYCPLCSEFFMNSYLWLKHLKKKHCFNRDNYLEANSCVIFQNQCECCMETLGGQNEVSFEQFQEHLLSSLPKHFSTKLVYKCSSCCNLFKNDIELDVHRESCDTAKIFAAPPKKTKKIANHPFFAESEFNQKENNVKNEDFVLNGLCLKPERGQRNENSINNSNFLLGAWRNLTRELYKPHHQLLSPRRKIPTTSVLPSKSQRCRHCNRNVDSNILTRHEKNCFYNTKRRCKTCFKACSTKAALLDHGHRHLQEEYRICLFCQNIPLRNDETLWEHIRLVHTDDVKNFPVSCPICSLLLLNRNMLEVHFEFHHGPIMCGKKEAEDCLQLSKKPFAQSFMCPKCDQKFSTLRMWITHTKFGHIEAPVSNSNGTSKSTVAQNEDSEAASERGCYADSFICPKCDQKFASFRMWNVHTKFAHMMVTIRNGTSIAANEKRELTFPATASDLKKQGA